MDNAMMIGLSRQMTLRRAMDVVANNIANANTAGFKVEHLLHEAQPADTATHTDGPSDIQFATTWGMGRDFSQGDIELTNRLYDMAIEGEGFFGVETAGGVQYTRDGRFRLDEIGQLVTADGSPVLDADTRAPIVLDPSVQDLRIVGGGQILENGNPVGRIGVFEIEDRARLSKAGTGRFEYPLQPGEAEPLAMFEPVVRQGYVEASNVSSITELTDMMAVMRSYQSVSKFLKEAEDLQKRSIERLGKA
ncbi:flagellar hook-basal body complex protein [Maricaulis sp.]|uniref:flagellar hook-basal body complex protein n=1 Tax=Maricaulis sp. TaxID=1486257 RepID=UPI00261B1DEB|nr:flagellar hook-basal body complex protein [Maricaulis sp.]